MSQKVCPQCGAPINPGAAECKFCGESLVQQQVNQQFNQEFNQQATYSSSVQQVQPQIIIQQQFQREYDDGVDPSWPVKSKIAAGILGILFGGIGLHRFYLGKIGSGLLYLLFCWTGIPAIIGFVAGIIYLCTSDEAFQQKHHVRVR